MNWRQLCTLPFIFLLGLWLAYTVFQLPIPEMTIQPLIQEALPKTGVDNPVTAVLLNFRGYDTFLELVVLLLAATAVWSLDMLPSQREDAPGLVLGSLVNTLLCVLVLVAFYFLWLGSHGPGGAFQAGALLGAAGVLVLLAGKQPNWHINQLKIRVLLVLGVAAFSIFGLVTLILGDPFMTYPPAFAKPILFCIEFMAMLSIGLTLVGLFSASAPEHNSS